MKQKTSSKLMTKCLNHMFSQRFLPTFRCLVLCFFGYNHLVKIKFKVITFQALLQKVQVNITRIRFSFLADTNCFYNIFLVHISEVHSTLLTSFSSVGHNLKDEELLCIVQTDDDLGPRNLILFLARHHHTVKPIS